MPALERGLAKAGRSRSDFDVSAPIIVVSGLDAEAFEMSRQIVKMQLAFYASTPSYKPVLELHGWEDLLPTLNRLSKQGEWQKMGELISDEILETFAVVCEDPAQIAPCFAQRYGDLIDTWHCTVDLPDRELQSQLLRSLQRR